MPNCWKEGWGKGRWGWVNKMPQGWGVVELSRLYKVGGYVYLVHSLIIIK